MPTLSSKTGVSRSVPVNVTSITGTNAKSADFVVTYDPTVLSYSGAVLGSVGTSNGGGRVLTVNSTTPGSLSISIFGSTELQGPGALVNLNFNVTGAIGTSSTVNFSSFVFNEGDPCDTTTNGSLAVTSGSISGTITYGNALGSPAPPRAVPGVQLNAAGSINRSAASGSDGSYSINGMGTGQYTVTPSKTGDVRGSISAFDASDVAVHVVGMAPQLTGNRAVVADVSGNGTISSFDAAMIATYAANLEDDIGSAGQWIFVPEDLDYENVNIDYTEQNYVALLMGDVSGNWNKSLVESTLTFEDLADPLTIAAEKVSAARGTSITIPVKVGDTTGLGIRSFEFDLHYDADVLEPSAAVASLSGTVSDGRVLTVNTTKKGVLRIVASGAYPLEGAGELLKLHFNVIGAGNASSELRWENFRLNEGGINFKTVDGQVNVASLADEGSISGRVLSPRGDGIAKARVIVTDTKGNTRAVMTSSLGYFQVSELGIGESYSVRIETRRYRFAVQTVSLTSGNAVELQLIGLE